MSEKKSLYLLIYNYNLKNSEITSIFPSGEHAFKILIKYGMFQRHARSLSLVPIGHKYFHSFIHCWSLNATFSNYPSHIEFIVHFRTPFKTLFFSSLVNSGMADKGEDPYQLYVPSLHTEEVVAGNYQGVGLQL